ncbi:MAG: cell wall-binding repeat-containing protein [Clostridia bacterium]|nr:cell wall-binding repeat-containing protein [Clostridia bacterium]
MNGLDGHAGFKVDSVNANPSGIWTIKYSGAAAGDNEYISVIVTDGTSSTVKYYGRIAAASSADNAVARVNLLDKVGQDDKVYVFNEQYNEGSAIDLASGATEITSIKKDYGWDEGSGTEQAPYIIANANDWISLQKYVAAGENTAGLYWRLGANIEVTDIMVGMLRHPFEGTFDGDGYTLTFTSINHPERTAPFRYIRNATICNLHVNGNITGTEIRASGLIGENSGYSLVYNCRVSVKVEGSSLVGGFCIGTGNELCINGCVFDGQISGLEQSGGFVAWGTSGLDIVNCVCAPQSGSSITGGTFYYAGDGTGTARVANSYYMEALGAEQGKKGYRVTAAKGAKIDFGLGEYNDVSGITEHATGLGYDGVFYAGGGEEVHLFLAEGKTYSASAGTLIEIPNTTNGYMLVMPDKDVEIYALNDLTGAEVKLSATVFTYNGKVQKPAIKTISGETLTPGTDYTAKWSNASSKNAGTYTVTITGRGKYIGTTKATYTIKPKGITPTVTLAKKEYTYTGKAQKPAVTVKDGNMKLVADADYTVTYASGRKNAGTYKVTVKLQGNYSGSATATFKIVPAKVSLPVAKSGLTYNGAKQTGVAAAAHYTVTGGTQTNAGTYTAKATLKDTKNYTWSDGKTTAKSIKWTIAKANIKSAAVASIKDQTFTGAALKPAPVVKMTLNGKPVTLKAGTDYKVTYKNNTVPGTATVTIIGQGNFTGNKTTTFKIVKAKATATRLSGNNRYTTSQAIADAYKEALGVKQFDAVCVADGTNYPDALAGSYLAALKKAPIISIDKNNPTAANTLGALAYIKKNLKPKGTVYLLGGSGSVPEVLEKALKSCGFTVKRVWGQNRYLSNIEILKEGKVVAGSEIIVCTGADFADALSASATGKPVLLVGGKALLAEQKEYLKAVNAGKFTIIGDQTVVLAEIENELKTFAPVTRVTGRTTYERSVAIAKKYFPGIQAHINIADGKNFPDALCGGPMAVLTGGPLLLVDEPATIMDPVLAYVKTARTFKVTIFGGPGSVSDALVNKILSVN